jgi:hypothetical protein
MARALHAAVSTGLEPCVHSHARLLLGFNASTGPTATSFRLTQAARRLRVPVRARKITGVELDGRSAKYRVEPGFARPFSLSKPTGTHAKLVVHSNELLRKAGG